MAEDTATVDTAAAPAPAAAQAPIAEPTSVAAQVPVTESSEGKSGFWHKLDWVEVGFGALAALTLYFVIYYYKNKVVFEATQKSALAQQIAVMQTQIDDLEKGINTEANATTTGFSGF
jgi:hypothetical protein